MKTAARVKYPAPWGGKNKPGHAPLLAAGYLTRIGPLVTAIIIGITDSALSFIAFALGFVAGLALMIYAGAKYNR